MSVSPRIALITMGKRARRKALAILASMPTPIQMTNSGATAILGNELSMMIAG